MTKALMIIIYGISFLLILINQHVEATTVRRTTRNRIVDKTKNNNEQRHEGTNKRLVEEEGEVTSEDDIDDDLAIFLNSEECSYFMDNLANAAEVIWNFDDDAIIQYVCNDIQREEILSTENMILHDVTNATSFTCESAYELQLMDEEVGLIEAMSSHGACVEQITRELEISRALSEAASDYDVEEETQPLLLIIIEMISMMQLE